MRKAAHVTEFAALGMSLFYTVRDYLEWKCGRINVSVPQNRLTSQSAASDRMHRIVLPWVIGTLYAVSDEIHQLFVEGRSCEVRDMLLDSVGVAAGVLLANWLDRYRRRHKCERPRR